MLEKSDKMINVTKTYLPDIKKYKLYIDKIFKSGWLTNNGKLVQELEKRLRKYLGVRNIILVANGTLALQIAYKVLGLKGDVITTPFSFVATTSSIVWEGLNPIFVDIDRETFCIDPKKIEKSITPDCSAVVPVHVFGNACEVESIQKIANKHSLKVIYDASHAFGVRYKGKSLLNFGDISTLSFHATKIFHTCEGGALVIKDNKLYEKARLMADFGIDDKNTIKELGINAKMNELEAAMGLCVLDGFQESIRERKTLFENYYKSLSGKLKFQAWNYSDTHNYNYCPVLFASQQQMLSVKAGLNKRRIYPRRYFYPSLEGLPYLKGYTKMPVSQDISSRILCLPIYKELSRTTQHKIINLILQRLT
jgi:dTDP-4-amino-4,6-dideoxygalactose transaminase